MIEFRKVNKWFGSLHVLKDIDLSIEAGKVVVVCGPSGSGKSTLIRCINRLETVQSGEITVNGRSLSDAKLDTVRLRTEVGMVFQSFNLYPHMSVLRNITLAPVKVLGLPREVAEEQAMALLTRIGLQEKALEYPDRLSGGQQQRVAIVRALAMGPRLLLLDEITSALDPELVSEVLNIVRQLGEEGMTMMLATHEMGFARDVASKVCFLCDGVLLEEGPPEQIFGDPREDRTRMFLKRIIEAGRL